MKRYNVKCSFSIVLTLREKDEEEAIKIAKEEFTPGLWDKKDIKIKIIKENKL